MGDTHQALGGRRALVTGGAGLLGKQHVLALAEAGADVTIADIDEEAAVAAVASLQSQTPGTLDACFLDVTSPESIRSAAGRPYDILVNNAAIDAKVGADGGVNGAHPSRLEEFPLEAWDKEVRVGLTGAFLCAQAFGAPMAERGNGVILNIASDLSVIAPDQRIYQIAGRELHEQPVKPVTYSVIKSGLVGLTRYLAAYWADRGVRVNALSPGGVYAGQAEGFVERLTNLIPMGRMANEAEYRSAVVFLCSESSSYMTGQNMVIDGGRSII